MKYLRGENELFHKEKNLIENEIDFIWGMIHFHVNSLKLKKDISREVETVLDLNFCIDSFGYNFRKRTEIVKNHINEHLLKKHKVEIEEIVFDKGFQDHSEVCDGKKKYKNCNGFHMRIKINRILFDEQRFIYLENLNKGILGKC